MHIHEGTACWNPVKREHNYTNRKAQYIHMIYARAFSVEAGFFPYGSKRRDELLQV